MADYTTLTFLKRFEGVKEDGTAYRFMKGENNDDPSVEYIINYYDKVNDAGEEVTYITLSKVKLTEDEVKKKLERKAAYLAKLKKKEANNLPQGETLSV